MHRFTMPTVALLAAFGLAACGGSSSSPTSSAPAGGGGNVLSTQQQGSAAATDDKQQGGGINTGGNSDMTGADSGVCGEACATAVNNAQDQILAATTQQEAYSAWGAFLQVLSNADANGQPLNVPPSSMEALDKVLQDQLAKIKAGDIPDPEEGNENGGGTNPGGGTDMLAMGAWANHAGHKTWRGDNVGMHASEHTFEREGDLTRAASMAAWGNGGAPTGEASYAGQVDVEGHTSKVSAHQAHETLIFLNADFDNMNITAEVHYDNDPANHWDDNASIQAGGVFSSYDPGELKGFDGAFYGSEHEGVAGTVVTPDLYGTYSAD